jgi:hypothetical protein
MSGTLYLDPFGMPVLTFEDPASPPPAESAPVEYTAPPTPAELWNFLGWGGTPDTEQTAQAQAHLNRTTALVRSHTRGRGFFAQHCAPDLFQVILSAAARSVNNPTDATRVQAGQFSETPGSTQWLLSETITLNGHRRRAC